MQRPPGSPWPVVQQLTQVKYAYPLLPRLPINVPQMLDRARVIGEICVRITDARLRRIVTEVLSTWKTVQIRERIAAVYLQSLVRGRRGR